MIHPYGYTLSNNPKIAIPKIGVKIRQKISPLILKMAKKMNKTQIILLDDNRLKKDNRPKIYVASHGFPEDVIVSALIINKPCYILAGNKEVFFHSKEGFATWLYGGIVFDRMNIESRKSSLYKMKRVLELGSNILIFSEGGWNMSDNKLISDLHGGFYDLAKSGNYDIVPIVTHKNSENKCLAYIGSEIDVNNIDIDIYNEVYNHISKCINKCIELPIKDYKNNKRIKLILLELKSKIQEIIKNSLDDEQKVKKISSITKNTIDIIKNIIKDDEENEIEKSIINSITMYLKSIVNARKSVVVNNIRDIMATQKYRMIELSDDKRIRKQDISLEESIQEEKETLIKKVIYYDWDEEQKSMFVDPIKEYLKEPFTDIKKRIKK